ncbi:MAG: protein arginine kinase [Firmicutes bacterium]|jgi:protein arginine kinase|uniref:Protein-arginine kinase n=1 Tax=Sulfobacillus benefaciens TaxID=453960 RepID=A0A2T2WUW2_9FIRM|nr:protein arginine kinase [Bacillota bacterium]MCL5014615.1 protein arginine kinase [Bacillota bacterium]PSR26012.1 MAG: protein arginine kinase [Sulfobacillus benefaciens]
MAPFSAWMQAKGPDADIVLSSRIRLARNLKNTVFPNRLNDESAKKMLDQIEWAIGDLGSGWNMHFQKLDSLSPIHRQVQVEKHLISPALIEEPVKYKALAVDEKESISIMVNEEDHLRIQILLSGLQLKEAWTIADQLDDVLEQRLDYAYDNHSGYLTACPTNIGTAMRASVMVHLPALVLTRQASQVFTTLAQIGMVVRGLYGEGSDAVGNIFQISNQVSLGLSEEEFIHNLATVTQQIVGRERHARQYLQDNAGVVLTDRVERAWGLLTHARIMSSEEALRLLSEVKLGQDLNLLPQTESTFTQLTLLTRPGFLQSLAGHELQAAERDQIRAQFLRSKLRGESGPE